MKKIFSIFISILFFMLSYSQASEWKVHKKAQVVNDFNGWDGETLFKLSDGTYWVQIAYAYWYHYAYRPDVTIYEKNGSYALSVDGEDEYVAVAKTNAYESQIDGDYEGWEGETSYRLTNGQVWKQAHYFYLYFYAYMPHVIVYRARSGWKMQLVGLSEVFDVINIK